jgi:uncharacterized protein YggE
MKYLLIPFLVLTAALTASAGQDIDQQTISVRGHAEIRVVPDEVLLTLGVESFSEELDGAKADNDRRVTAIVAAAVAHGVSTEHLKTDYLEIEPRYKDSYEHQRLLGYLVRKSIVITVRDLEAFEDLLAESLTAGANYVHGIEFRTTELRRHRDRARSLALVAAREKAEAMASEYGRLIGDAVTIGEGYSGFWSPYGSWWGGRWGGGASQNVVQTAGGGGPQPNGPTAPGQLSISAGVNVTFELLGGRD